MSKPLLVRRADALILLAAMAALPGVVQAQVYKCIQANGTTAFQSTPCATGARPLTRPTADQLNAQRAPWPRDEKPGDDPYAGSAESRPHPQAPSWSGSGDDEAGRKSSSLVDEVQARNRRENEREAYREAHKDDKHVDMAACNSARHNLGVLSEQRPVFSYDNKGNRVFVEDKDRAGRIEEARRWVASTCP